MVQVMAWLRHVETYRTALSLEAGEAAVRANVTEGRLLGLTRGDRPFRGEVGPGRLRVAPANITSNSFGPVVVGELCADAEGTRVTLELEPHPAMLAFVALWTVSAGLLTVFMVSSISLEPEALVPFVALPLVGPAIAMLAFRVELPRTLAAMKRVLPPR
jgi:hypothetical protein